LLGPGDSGKSTILDGIDLCLGARRSISFSDADFHGLDHEKPIRIAVTLGELTDTLKNMEAYGEYHVGFNPADGTLAPEPDAGLETALTLTLTVESDLEPQWTLSSPRAEAASRTRNLNWSDRLDIAPTRLGGINDVHLTWKRGSVLTKLADGKADASKQLAMAARALRASFGDDEAKELEPVLKLITETAQSLGVSVGDSARALIDAASVSVAGGGISLHNGTGVPLRSMGIGSTRLLIAGIQRQAAATASIVLVDELEYGLEPHRIIRLLSELGAKDAHSPMQVFMTTHSPVVITELSADQLHVVRRGEDQHIVTLAASAGNVQGTIRRYPYALLAQSILVCEGATEVGLIRGLDAYFQDRIRIAARGVALVDGKGGDTYNQAIALQALGYRVAVLRDSDVPAPKNLEDTFKDRGGSVFAWPADRALEHELLLSLPQIACEAMVAFAVKNTGEQQVDSHIRHVSDNRVNLSDVQTAELISGYDGPMRETLGMAAHKGGWFKTVTLMEEAAEEIVAPNMAAAEASLTAVLEAFYNWTSNGKP
jgi:putative ATP-dependent endonuclease of OLD family